MLVKVRKNGQHSTCLATLLQNVLKSDAARFITLIKSVLQQIRLLTGLNVVSKTRTHRFSARFGAVLQRRVSCFCCLFNRSLHCICSEILYRSRHSRLRVILFSLGSFFYATICILILLINYHSTNFTVNREL